MYNPYANGMEGLENPWDSLDEQRNWDSPEEEFYIPTDAELFDDVDDMSSDVTPPKRKPEEEIIREEEPEEVLEDDCPTVEFPAIVPRAPSLAKLLVSRADSYFYVRCRDGSVLHITGCTPSQSKDFQSPRSSRFARMLGLERDLDSGTFSLVTVYSCSEEFPEFNEWNVTPDEIDPESIIYGGIPADIVRRVIIARGGEIVPN